MHDFKEKVVNYEGYNFTNSQKQALEQLTLWYQKPNDLLFTLSGRAGTGKTYLLKYFIDKIVKHPICVSAPTHKAVRQVERSTGRKGKTLQSLHGLRPNINLEDFDLHNIKFDQLGTPTLNNYKIVVIDECSMVNKSLHEFNMRRASDLKVKILYVGDPIQLPPVSKDDADAVESPTFRVKNRYELTEIVRQDKDNPLTQLLEILVNDVKNNGIKFVHHLKANPIMVNDKGEGYRVFTNAQQFFESAVNCFKDDKFSNNPDFARIASWKNQTVLNYNIAIRNSLIPHFSGPGANDELIDLNDLLIGYKTITDEFNETVIINSEDYVVTKVVARDSDEDFKSYAVTIEPRHGGKRVNISIVDYRDKSFAIFYEKVKRRYFNALYAHGSNRSTKWKEYFNYKDEHLTLINFPIKDGEDVKSYVQKDIDYAFSLTTHKLQGSTIENTYVDLNDMLFYTNGGAVINSKFAPNATMIRNKLVYTAISRTSKICNIYLNI